MRCKYKISQCREISVKDDSILINRIIVPRNGLVSLKQFHIRRKRKGVPVLYNSENAEFVGALTCDILHRQIDRFEKMYVQRADLLLERYGKVQLSSILGHALRP